MGRRPRWYCQEILGCTIHYYRKKKASKRNGISHSPGVLQRLREKHVLHDKAQRIVHPRICPRMHYPLCQFMIRSWTGSWPDVVSLTFPASEFIRPDEAACLRLWGTSTPSFLLLPSRDGLLLAPSKLSTYARICYVLAPKCLRIEFADLFQDQWTALHWAA